MKQITLANQVLQTQRAGACAPSLLWIWGAYGLAVSAVWHWVGGNETAQIGTWVVAVLAGLGLMFGSLEV